MINWKRREREAEAHMPEYVVRGKTYAGQEIDTVIEADSPRLVLITVLQTYNSRLRKPFELYIQSEATEEERNAPVPEKKWLRSWYMDDADILWVAAAIRANEYIEEEDLHAFEGYCKTLMSGILDRKWSDVPEYPRSDKEMDLIRDIVMEFLPKYNSRRSKKLRTFLWKKINSRVVRDWRRLKYIKADRKETAEPKAAILADFIRRNAPTKGGDEQLTEKEQKIQTALLIAQHRSKLTPTERRELFMGLLNVKLIDELKITPRQCTVLKLIYGEERKEEEVAKILKVKQPSINKVKKAAECAVFKSLKKKYGES